MTGPTTRTRVRLLRSRRRVAAAAIVLVTCALVVGAAVTAKPSSAHPSEGYPCSRCHTQTLRATTTLSASRTTVASGKPVTLSGKVQPNRAGLKAAIQKSRNGSTWTTWKKVTLSASSTYSAKWTAPATKGKYYFRTKYLGDNRYKQCVSAKRLVTVK